MAFVTLNPTDIDAGSPLTETLMTQIKDNLDDLNSRTGATESISSNDIRDDFKSAGVLDTTLWDQAAAGPSDTFAIGTTYMHTASFGASANTDISAIGATNTHITWDIAQERVVVMEMRARTTSSGANRGLILAAQDWALGAIGTAYFTDITDFCGLYLLNNDLWTLRIALGGAGGDRAVDFVASTAWHTIKIVITCSATAGNRKVQAYSDGTEISGSPWTTNLPTASMRPVAGVYVNGAGSNAALHLDYFLIYDQTRPVAA